MDYSKTPTVVPFGGFDANADAVALRTAMKGFGTDEQAIIDILCARSNSQRQEIIAAFLKEYGRDLIKDLKSELGGKFEDVIIGLMLPEVDFLCQELHKSMKGLGTDEEALIEIICPRTNDEMKQIVAKYEDMYNRPLAQHICSEVSGDFARLLTLIVTGCRDPAGQTNPDLAKEHAEKLFNAGAAKMGTDEEVFNKIMAHDSFAQLRLVFEEYKNLTGKTIEQALKSELGGDLLNAMLAIVECVQSPPGFFAKRLHKAMEGMGTNDSTLIRIIVSRCEIDLGAIKAEYERLYDKTLLSAVKSECSGDYKRALCAIIGNA
ncbi:annexin B10-like [Culicoides brevitarsis]|uniref:annexin B10-like n=1 Tax=Culicoides brevitarsis TaxID=469753 RepID=UPI00307B4A17